MEEMTKSLLHLRVMRNELLDLDLEDIKRDLIDRWIFSEADIADFLAEKDDHHRLDLIYTTLEQKLHKGQVNIVQEFLNVLKPCYSWIVESHSEHVRNGNSGPIGLYNTYRNNTTVPNIDELNVYRPKLLCEIQKYLRQLKHGSNEQRYLFVYGPLGTGKWTLVSQACENFSVVELMGYQIFYLSLANCAADEQILEQLENLSMQMETDYKCDDITYNGHYPTNEIYLRKRRLIQLFEYRYQNSLLILSHVRNAELLKYFDLKCKTVVITNNIDVYKQVNKKERCLVQLKGGFTEEESMELFGKALRLKSDYLPPVAHDIHRKCNGNPFVIKLIARKMSEYRNTNNKASNTNVVQEWQKIANNMSRYTIAVENTTIKSILNQLSNEAQEAFNSLVIFRDNVKIPHSVLQRYWKLSSEQMDSLVTELINKGLLEKRFCKNQSIFYVLHFVCYSFLLKENPGEIHANLHRQLVESYRISDAFDNRTELDLLTSLPNDNYLHFYLANHLERSGLHELFPILFRDFGFLEQKIRYTGLPNTVGDLRTFQHRIFTGMNNPDLYAELLTEFLMGAEVLLSKSADTCLLQLALNCTGMIADEARIQANQYTNRVWFYDIDHNHPHQLVQVHSAPRKVRFQDTGSALVSLDNNQISLVDLSPSYSAPTTIFDGNRGPVKEMQMVNSILIALDDEGTLNIWSMKNIPQDRNARQHESDGNSRRTAQSLQSSDHKNDPFVSFSFVSSKNSSKGNNTESIDLFAITKNGCLNIYTGISSFVKINCYYTQIKDTYMIKPLVEDPSKIPKLLFLTEDNHGCIFQLTSTSIEYRFEEPRVVNIHYTGTELILVGPNGIKRRTFKRNDRNQLQTDRLETIYSTPKHHQNTCSAISDDFQYIILGTTQGISIFSIQDNVEVLRTNISHNILDVDIFSLDDDRYRYILISSSEDSENVINMYSLMVTANNQLVSNPYQLQDNLNYLVDLDHEPATVKTVDRKHIIQELRFCAIQGSEDFIKLTPTSENNSLSSQVQQLIQCRSGYYIGLMNGEVLRLTDWSNPKEGPHPEKLLHLDAPIHLLKYFDDLQLLVAATENSCQIVMDGLLLDTIDGEICECYLYLDRYLVFIYENCSIEIFNAVSKTIESDLHQRFSYGASAFNKQCLIICATDGAINQLCLELEENDRLEMQVVHVFGTIGNAPLKWISSCAVSTHNELLAVGYKNGHIEVYNIEERKLITTLESHKFQVASLYFSPWQDPNSPHILVSIGEQIVFWNLSYVINNRLDSNDFKRHSNRYKSRSTLVSPAIDIQHRSSLGGRSSGFSSPLAGSPARNGSFTFDFDETEFPWINKVGPSNKPELLSCIKLIGSAKKLVISRDFKKFFTIDDEGYLYYLRLYQPDRIQFAHSFECPVRERPPNGSFHN